MINTVSRESLEKAIRSDNPSWSEEGIQSRANEYLSLWDERLSACVSEYVMKGVETDFRHGEFSILQIKALRNNCGYLQAISLMDAYMKDPVNGKALILRRGSSRKTRN